MTKDYAGVTDTILVTVRGADGMIKKQQGSTKESSMKTAQNLSTKRNTDA